MNSEHNIILGIGRNTIILCSFALACQVMADTSPTRMNAEKRDVSNKIIHHSLRLHCDAHRAFELFTVDTLLESWLTMVADVEPLVGGKYELFWEPEDRQNNSTIGCRVTAIERPKYVSFEWKSPKQFKHFANDADPLTHVVVSFIPSDDSTEVHMIHSGWRSSAEWEEARQWQDRAWRVAFNALDKQINGE